MTAVLRWWLSGHPGLPARAASSSNGWHISVKSLAEDSVGAAIYEASGFHRAEERFWRDAEGNPATKHLVEQCVAAWRAGPGETGVSGVRRFVRTSLSRLLARSAKEMGLVPAGRRRARGGRGRRGVLPGGG